MAKWTMRRSARAPCRDQRPAGREVGGLEQRRARNERGDRLGLPAREGEPRETARARGCPMARVRPSGAASRPCARPARRPDAWIGGVEHRIGEDRDPAPRRAAAAPGAGRAGPRPREHRRSRGPATERRVALARRGKGAEGQIGEGAGGDDEQPLALPVRARREAIPPNRSRLSAIDSSRAAGPPRVRRPALGALACGDELVDLPCRGLDLARPGSAWLTSSVGVSAHRKLRSSPR